MTEINYDERDRVTQVTLNNDTHYSYQYDDNGNVILSSQNGQIIKFEYFNNSNQIKSLNGTNYKYDNNGRIINDGSHTYQYDDLGRLTKVDDTWLYQYNGLNLRTSKKNLKTGEETHFTYDEEGLLLGEYTKDGKVLREYIYYKSLPIALIENGTMYYIHNDHQDIPRVITDHSGKVVWRWDFSPKGEISANSDPDNNGEDVVMNLRFKGQFFDAETGNHYNHNRYYQPTIGRYLQPDPMGVGIGGNSYVYVENDTINQVDRTGLWNGFWSHSNGRLNTIMSRLFTGATPTNRGYYITGQHIYIRVPMSVQFEAPLLPATWMQTKAIGAIKKFWNTFGDMPTTVLGSSKRVYVHTVPYLRYNPQSWVLYFSPDVSGECLPGQPDRACYGQQGNQEFIAVVHNSRRQDLAGYGWTTAHEFGHLLGLTDQYNVNGNGLPLQGWADSLMGQGGDTSVLSPFETALLFGRENNWRPQVYPSNYRSPTAHRICSAANNCPFR